MHGPIVTDHALVRFPERAGGLDVEALRTAISASLVRAHSAASEIGGGNYIVSTEELSFVVREEKLTTVLPALNAAQRAAALTDHK